MVTYRTQLINFYKGNSDVFKQPERPWSPLGHFECLFACPFLSLTSPVSFPFSLSGWILFSCITPLCTLRTVYVLWRDYLNENRVFRGHNEFFPHFARESQSSVGDKKPSSQSQRGECVVGPVVWGIVVAVPLKLKGGNHWFDSVTRFG